MWHRDDSLLFRPRRPAIGCTPARRLDKSAASRSDGRPRKGDDACLCRETPDAAASPGGACQHDATSAPANLPVRWLGYRRDRRSGSALSRECTSPVRPADGIARTSGREHEDRERGRRHPPAARRSAGSVSRPAAPAFMFIDASYQYLAILRLVRQHLRGTWGPLPRNRRGATILMAATGGKNWQRRLQSKLRNTR